MKLSKMLYLTLFLAMLLQSQTSAQLTSIQSKNISKETTDLSEANNQIPARRVTLIKVGKIGTILDVFTQTGQIVNGDNDDIYIGAKGTVIGNALHEHQLHVGHFLVDTGKLPVSITTRLGKITIAPESTAIVDAPARGTIYITAVGGTDPSAVSFTSAVGKTPASTKSATIKAGEQLSVSDKPTTDDVTSSALIPLLPEKVLTTSAFNLIQYWQQKSSLWVRSAILASNKKDSRLTSHINQAVQNNPGFDIHNIQTPALSIPHNQQATQLFATPNTMFMQSSPGTIVLGKGGFLLYNLNDTIITTSVGEVHSDKDSLVAIEYKNGNMRVKACSGFGNVHIKIADKTIPLDEGREILVINHHPDATEAAPSDGIGRRHLRISDVGSEHSIVSGDFSMVSMLQNAKYMQELRNDKTKAAERLLDRIMKATAAINTIEANRGQYFSYDGKSDIPNGLFIEQPEQ